MTRRPAAFIAVAALLVGAVFVARLPGGSQTPPSATPAAAAEPHLTVIEAADTDALNEMLGRRAVVVGKVSKAEWSRSGQVCNVFFGDTDDGFLAVIFSRNRGAFDRAFDGDAAATLAGSRVRLDGTIEEYGGNFERWKGRPQMILRAPHQVTIEAD